MDIQSASDDTPSVVSEYSVTSLASSAEDLDDLPGNEFGHPSGQQQNQQLHQDVTTLSSSNVQKRAVLVGITYKGTEFQLDGAGYDCQRWHDMLVGQLGFAEKDVRMIRDDIPDVRYPTKQNIVQGLKWLISSAAPGDQLIFVYSGHGAQVEDEDGDECDGFDECLVPANYWEESGGEIVLDDELHAIFDNCPQGAWLTIFCDCCHSGTMFDLKYVIDPSRGIDDSAVYFELVPKLQPPCNQKVERLRSGWPKGRGGNLARHHSIDAELPSGSCPSAICTRGLSNLKHRAICSAGSSPSPLKHHLSGSRLPPKQGGKRTNAHIYKFGACEDHETALDMRINGKARGVMTECIMRAFQKESFKITYKQILLAACKEQVILKSRVPEIDQSMNLTFTACSHPAESYFLNGQFPTNVEHRRGSIQKVYDEDREGEDDAGFGVCARECQCVVM